MNKKSAEIVAEVSKIANSCGSYMDAIVDYSERNNIEIETVASIVKSSSVLKAKLREEAEELNMVEKSARLPI